ncbi:MAG: putative small integral membrane protein [Neolewinella sp.]|jgi:hypothetical protein
MDILYKTLIILHVSAGFSSIGLFFVPAFAKKGGKLHNRVGLWYTYTMWAVVVSAALLSCLQYFRGQASSALFLGFLALLTARPLYYGVAVLRNKKEPSERMRKTDLILRACLGMFSVFMIGNGFGWWGPDGHTLNLVFGSLGMLVWPSLIRDFRGVTSEYSWLEEHVGQIVVTAIAAFTAFLAFGGQRMFGNLFSGNLQLILWLMPTVLGVTFSRYYKWKLRKRKAAREPLFG